jgi:hypothetical protein
LDSSKKTLPQMPIDHPILIAPGLRFSLDHERGKGSERKTLEESTAFFRKMPSDFCWSVASIVREKERSIEVSFGGKAGSRLRSLIRRVTPEEREDAQKLKALYGRI